MRIAVLCESVLLVLLGGAAVSGQTVPAAQLAPTGVLRVGVHTASPMLATRTADGTVRGVAVDLGQFVAERLGVPFKLVTYENQEAFARSLGANEWDVGVGVLNNVADSKTDTSLDVLLADSQYVARPGRQFHTAADVDQHGVRVGVSQGGSSEQSLGRLLKSATVVPVPGGVDNAIDALRVGKVDLWAANTTTLEQIARGLPGATVVPIAWGTGRFGLMVPSGRSAARSQLAAIVRDAKRMGAVARALERAGLRGVRVAPE